MGLKVGIIGLANVGKSTLFNAILGRQQALVAPYPFATVEPNVGVVEVPDERLVKLREAMFPASDVPIVPATVTFVDIAGLVKGAAEGQGLGNQFLGHIRDVDLILHVLRDFDEGIPRAEDSKNPEHDAEIVKTELGLKDLEISERAKKDKKDEKDGTGMLSEKPVIYAVNVSEDKISDFGDRISDSRIVGSATSDSPTSDIRHPTSGSVFYFCAKVEEEISKMPKNEQKEYLKIYGLERSCLDRIIGECFQALGLISFFTAPAYAEASARQGAKWEIRAWPVRRDSPAPKAAGVIHSDFERLFIRAEIIEWEKLAEAGSWQRAKEKGWVRTEGRDYIVKDGEVCNFLIGK